MALDPDVGEAIRLHLSDACEDAAPRDVRDRVDDAIQYLCVVFADPASTVDVFTQAREAKDHAIDDLIVSVSVGRVSVSDAERAENTLGSESAVDCNARGLRHCFIGGKCGCGALSPGVQPERPEQETGMKDKKDSGADAAAGDDDTTVVPTPRGVREEVEKAVRAERGELFCVKHARHWENDGICPICDSEELNRLVISINDEKLKAMAAAHAAEANVKELVKAEQWYRANEQMALRRLSDALTGGAASTWDEVFYAADQVGSHGNQSLSEASGSAQSEAPK